jgi:hypothetical protein
MKFTAEQIDAMERDLSKAVMGARLFADQATSMRLSDLTSLMAEVRHFAHCVEYGGGATAAQERWMALFDTEGEHEAN